MGLSNFPIAAGVLPVIVMNTVISVTLLKNMVRSMLQAVGASSSSNQADSEEESGEHSEENARGRRVSITQFKYLCNNITATAAAAATASAAGAVECCVCLCRFEAEEEVSELSCKHFFHKGCLAKWFDNKHSTCPLCRSIV